MRLITKVLFCTILISLITLICGQDKEWMTEECMKDKKKTEKVEENYQNCQTEETVKEGLTMCCTVDEKMGCCPEKTAEQGRMMKIAFGIIGVTIGLAIIIFILTWCDKKSFPCLIRCEEKCRPCCESCEESLICCEDRVQKRKYERQVAEHEARLKEKEVLGQPTNPRFSDDRSAGNINLSMPAEMRTQEERDDFWF